MALNGKWMFESDGFNLHSLSIASNGSLKQVSEILGDGKTLLQDLSLDHTGATLYVGTVAGSGDNGYSYYAINNSTGSLSFIGSVGGSDPDDGNTPLAFIANNVFAYSSFCALLQPDIFGFQRNASGTLTQLNINPATPSGENYCPFKAAPDTTNHVATPVWNTNNSTAPWQLAVYTADNSGNLTTTSTSSNMPKVAVGAVNDVWASPTGKLLAVGGASGLQIFHYNGANPITKFTGALVTTSIDQVFWDNANHLYAISQKAGKLYVFTVTSTGATQATGQWYLQHLGIALTPTSAGGTVWQQEAGPTAFSPFAETTKYFGDPNKVWMVNFRVHDLDKRWPSYERQELRSKIPNLIQTWGASLVCMTLREIPSNCGSLRN